MQPSPVHVPWSAPAQQRQPIAPLPDLSRWVAVLKERRRRWGWAVVTVPPGYFILSALLSSVTSGDSTALAIFGITTFFCVLAFVPIGLLVRSGLSVQKALPPRGWLRCSFNGGPWKPPMLSRGTTLMGVSPAGIHFWSLLQQTVVPLNAVVGVELSRRVSTSGQPRAVSHIRIGTTAGDSFFVADMHPDLAEVALAPLRLLTGHADFLVRREVM